MVAEVGDYEDSGMSLVSEATHYTLNRMQGLQTINNCTTLKNAKFIIDSDYIIFIEHCVVQTQVRSMKRMLSLITIG